MLTLGLNDQHFTEANFCNAESTLLDEIWRREREEQSVELERCLKYFSKIHV